MKILLCSANPLIGSHSSLLTLYDLVLPEVKAYQPQLGSKKYFNGAWPLLLVLLTVSSSEIVLLESIYQTCGKFSNCART